ncbi:2-phosphosulfolactate phosphatase [Rummeliibacillus sp. JY-2-4R]
MHVILKKEELDEEKLTNNKIAVVFDILLATSTITTFLKNGAKEVIPVLNEEEAIQVAKDKKLGSYLMVGEYLGKTIEGMLPPHPNALINCVKDKSIILSTTNGTVAIRKAIEAKKVYIACLLNAKSVAQQIINHDEDETIILVCSGSSGAFNIEDFFGAGYFIDKLLSHAENDFEFTDAAFAAHQFYKGQAENGIEILRSSRVGKKLVRKNLSDEIDFILQFDLYDVVPYVKNKQAVVLD